METLFEKYYQKLAMVPLGFSRYLAGEIDWKNRLIGIKGARGTGKTTLLLQHAKTQFQADNRTLYVSLDDRYFLENNLVDLASRFVKEGGQNLLLDEVHRYPTWSQEIKNIYDDQPELRIIFTGSSIIHLHRAKADLSRRAVMYELFGLSYREFLNIKLGLDLKPIRLEGLLGNHTSMAMEIIQNLKPLQYFKDYLQHGYYPYFLENEKAYDVKLMETISLALYEDLQTQHPHSFASIEKMRLLLSIVAESVPFKPNISNLSDRTGITRSQLMDFLHQMEDLRIVKGLYASNKGISLMQKPEKLFLHHPNLHFALANGKVEPGSIRESFFVNQTAVKSKVTYTDPGDFLIEKKVFEIGGKGKTRKQLKELDDAFIVSDDLEIGHGTRIPLWLFGFLY